MIKTLPIFQVGCINAFNEGSGPVHHCFIIGSIGPRASDEPPLDFNQHIQSAVETGSSAQAKESVERMATKEVVEKNILEALRERTED